ncbi:MAG: DUF1254 domain-containing protein [Bauldia sp.]|uniref:DUF1214 domain-containing protein n=1 Tax=Bauldia sp. TaxID=2575872 RepID=UPI001E012B5E|nr:DUF1214 domain-containing protein [Bauldia sp.]MCB1495831.1 DUF1254 domain-containing protein [Bauldia sp.]
MTLVTRSLLVRPIAAISAAVLAILLASVPAFAADAPDEETLSDAYVYLLGRGLAIRQEHIDAAAADFEYNVIHYNPLGTADFVNPNLDVAYLEAWIAVDDDTPALLEVPKIEGRYYTVQILDEWGEVIVNINQRTFPSMPYGTFAFVAPGSTAPIPEGAVRITLHGRKAKLLGRVELKGDPEGAVALQKQFMLRSMGTPRIAPPPTIPEIDNEKLVDSTIFDHAGPILASALDINPLAAQTQQQVYAIADYVASGDEARASIDGMLKDKVIPGFLDYALTKSVPYLNHWMVADRSGNYGADYRARTSANLLGIWANVPSEVIYFVGLRDSNDKELDGSASYVMHFPADALPQAQVNSYWSVILVGVPDYKVVSNSLNRYNFNTYSDLVPEPDGSMKIAIGPKPVEGVPESNWLPSRAGSPFSLTFRAYGPKAPIIQEKWQPPAVTPVE